MTLAECVKRRMQNKKRRDFSIEKSLLRIRAMTKGYSLIMSDECYFGTLSGFNKS